MNRYEPWKELNTSELEYLKNRYIESRIELSRLRGAVAGVINCYERMKREMAMHWDSETYEALCSLEIEEGMNEALIAIAAAMKEGVE